VVRELAARGLSVVLTSGPAAAEQAAARRIRDLAGVPVVDLSGRTSLPDLAAVLIEARLFVGVDSAPMHMAAALGVPVVALFGPSGEHSWGPWGEGHQVVAAPFLCRPCGQAGCLNGKRSHCLEAIAPADVLAAVDALLGAHVGQLP
jgi:heptosyltransferase-3